MFAVAILNLASPSGVEPETKPSQGLMISYFTTGINLVEAEGVAPSMFLMSLIYSQLPSLLGTHLQICNALFPMRVLKHTLQICFNTL